VAGNLQQMLQGGGEASVAAFLSEKSLAPIKFSYTETHDTGLGYQTNGIWHHLPKLGLPFLMVFCCSNGLIVFVILYPGIFRRLYKRLMVNY